MNPAPSSAKPAAYRWLVFALLSAAYLLVYFHRNSPAVVAVDLMRDLAADPVLLGLLGSAYFYPYAFMQIPSGLLTDSWGPRITVTVSFVLAGLASIMFGLAFNVSMAIAARILVGLGVSLLFVPAMKILTQWFKRTEFALMTGLLMAIGGLGALTAAAPLALVSQWIGWRGSFLVIGFVTLILAAAIWLLVRNRPQDLGLPAVEESSSQAEAIPLGRGIKMVLSRRSFWPLALWYFFTLAIFFSFAGLWGGPYLMQVYGLTKTQAGNVLSMLAVAMIVGSPFLSFISDRVLRSRKMVLVICSVVTVFLTAVLAFFPGSMSLPLLYLFCFVLSLCSSSIVVIAFTSAKELFPVAIAGTAMGTINFFPFLGGALMQPLIGWALVFKSPAGVPYPVADVYGRAFTLMFASAVIALICALLTEETLRKAD